jgi:hypothetical protein
MLYYYLLFFFIAVGAKFILALIMIYLLLPGGDYRCMHCDAETLLLGGDRAALFVRRTLRARLQRRWCPTCGRESLARPVLQRSQTLEPAPRFRTTTHR